MGFCSAARNAVFIGLLSFGLAQAQTPVSLAIHGPSSVYEAGSSEFRAVASWSDGTKSRVQVAWSASWASSNPAVAVITPFGSLGILTTGDVAGNAALNISATYFGPSGTLVAPSKSVTVLDASSFPSVAHTLTRRWNLLGNSIGAPLNVVAMFGNPLQPVAGMADAVVSVWKWDAVNSKWAVFSPRLTPTQLASFAAANNYSVLHVIHPGEGYWVNTSQPVALPVRSGGPVSLATGSIVNGWNLLSTGQTMTPPQLYSVVSEAPPPPGALQRSLWAWNADTQQWLFYAPSLEATGGPNAVKTYADANGFLDFATLNRQLGHGIGFWVNTGTVNSNSNLAPLGQAKAMFSELRTTVRAYSNDLKSGFLDAQSTRIRNDLQTKVSPTLPWVIRNMETLGQAVRLFDDVRDGNTSGYFVQPGTAGGTVAAARARISGSVLFQCVSNDMAGTQVTPALLTSSSCKSHDTNFDAYSTSFGDPYRNQISQLVTVSPGVTASDYNYQAKKQVRTEQWNGSFWVLLSDNFQLGTTQSGTLSRTYVPGTTNLSSVSVTGNLPSRFYPFLPTDPDADHHAVSLTTTRAVQNAGAGVYRYNIAGSVASKTAAGATMVTLSLASGSYYDAKEDANGNPLPNSHQSVHIVGKAETSASRFTGTLDFNAFASDADGVDYVPASSVFDGAVEDLSAGGAGTFLTGRFTVTLNNLASYRSLQPESAGNFLSFDTSFVGTIQAPSRPEMRLTVGSSRAGVDSYAIITNYTYGPVSVTGVATLDTFNTDNSTLTLTNQDSVTVTFLPHADAIVSKGGVTLGIIPFHSAIVYFSDGYFESL